MAKTKTGWPNYLLPDSTVAREGSRRGIRKPKTVSKLNVYRELEIFLKVVIEDRPGGCARVGELRVSWDTWADGIGETVRHRTLRVPPVAMPVNVFLRPIICVPPKSLPPQVRKRYNPIQ